MGSSECFGRAGGGRSARAVAVDRIERRLGSTQSAEIRELELLVQVLIDSEGQYAMLICWFSAGCGWNTCWRGGGVCASGSWSYCDAVVATPCSGTGQAGRSMVLGDGGMFVGRYAWRWTATVCDMIRWLLRRLYGGLMWGRPR